jgi:hypothetical protein
MRLWLVVAGLFGLLIIGAAVDAARESALRRRARTAT